MSSYTLTVTDCQAYLYGEISTAMEHLDVQTEYFITSGSDSGLPALRDESGVVDFYANILHQTIIKLNITHHEKNPNPKGRSAAAKRERGRRNLEREALSRQFIRDEDAASPNRYNPLFHIPCKYCICLNFFKADTLSFQSCSIISRRNPPYLPARRCQI